MSFRVESVRAQFPALQAGAAHFDGPGGSQVPRSVGEAVAATLLADISNRGHVSAASRRADQVVLDARSALADLVGADPRGVVFGRSMTALTYDLARTLARTWGPGDEVVVTRLDHDANIRPWVQAAQAVGATVRWVGFDRDTGELRPEDVAAELSARTRLVAVTGASNLLGTRPDLPAIATIVHARDALLFVDGVHLVPHAPVDLDAVGADFLACSPYKFFGPHCGVLTARPELLETLQPDKLLPSTHAVPDRFELGTLPFELMAGATAAVDFIAGLCPEATGSRRERVLASMAVVEAHEEALHRDLESRLAALDGVVLHGRAAERTPTVLFTVPGLDPAAVSESLARDGVNAPAGSFYALEAARWMGLGDGGGIRAGIAPYTDAGDVDRLVAAVERALGARGGRRRPIAEPRDDVPAR
jgi:cysteine desulfurase family protein (TIGR01976 family)